MSMSDRGFQVGAGVDAAIRRHGEETYPHECCGALVGRDGRADAAVALPNTTEEGPRRRFLVRPSDYRVAEQRAAQLGGELLGFYHSHPESSGAALAVRSRSRMADVCVRDRVGRRREGGGDDGVVFSKTTDQFSKRARSNMATKILIPTPLRPFTDKQDTVDAEGKTVGELLANLTQKHAGLKAHLYTEQGKLRSFVNVYVNDEDIRYLQKEQTPVADGDTISIIPSVAGGAPTITDGGRVGLQPTARWRISPTTKSNATAAT